MLYFDQMIEYTRQNICPETAKSEVFNILIWLYYFHPVIVKWPIYIWQEYCDLLIGRVTPLLFPWLFPSLSYILYVDK